MDDQPQQQEAPVLLATVAQLQQSPPLLPEMQIASAPHERTLASALARVLPGVKLPDERRLAMLWGQSEMLYDLRQMQKRSKRVRLDKRRASISAPIIESPVSYCSSGKSDSRPRSDSPRPWESYDFSPTASP